MAERASRAMEEAEAISTRRGLLEALRILQVEIAYFENGGAFIHGGGGSKDARSFLAGLKYAMEIVRDESNGQG